ncbi:MAG TPA: FixH family protein [Polyangia bacterium]|nr:FixH family protein [Polyangia bacterium]
MLRRALALVAVMTSLAGCVDAPSAAPDETSFASAPLQTITSSSGRLNIQLRWSPPTPVKGENAVELTFLDAQGVAVDGLDATVVPWMPAHGHGTSVQPETTTSATGALIASPLYLYMSGQWQLRLTITGGVDDAAVADVQIP